MKKRFAFAALAFLAAACGSDDDRAAVAAEVPTPGSESVVTPADPATTTPPAITGPVTFEDAEGLYREKRYAEAMEAFTVYAETKPENPWGFFMLGLSAWKSGDHQGAETAFRHAIEKDSAHIKSRLNLGRVLMETNRHAEALELFQSASDLDSTSSEAFRLQGRAYDGLGRVVDAIWAFKRAIVIDGRDVWALNNLGTTLIREGRYEDALGPLARAVELEPRVATFQNNLGMALERTGYYKTAAEAYRTAVGIDSSYAKPAVSLARVEQLTEADTLPPLDLTDVVKKFLELVETWRAEEA